MGTSLISHVYGRQSNGPSLVVIQQGIEQPVVRKLNSAALENFGRATCLAAACAEPAADAFAGKLLEARERAADFRLFVLDFFQRPLKPAVTDEIPPVTCGSLCSIRIHIGALRVHPCRGLNAAPLEEREEPRQPTTHAVLHPGVVGDIGRLAGPAMRSRQNSKGQYSMATTGLTMSGLPLSGASRGRSVDIW